MADSEDIEALQRGDSDLVQRDLREADLTGLDLRNRDLSGAHLEKSILASADLSGAKLSQAHLAQTNLQRANLSKADVTGTALTFVDFGESNLAEANFSRSHFVKCDLAGTDLRGADFRNCVFNDGNSFDRSISDERTLFDGATIFRPLARNNAFRFYRVERGKLVRLAKAEDQAPLVGVGSTSPGEVLDAIERAERALQDAASAPLPTLPEVPGIGHNQPPPEAALSPQEIEATLNGLRSIKAEMESADPNIEAIHTEREQLETRSKAIARWIAGKADLFAEEFARSLGKEAAKVHTWIGLWLVANGALAALANLVRDLFG